MGGGGVNGGDGRLDGGLKAATAPDLRDPTNVTAKLCFVPNPTETIHISEERASIGLLGGGGCKNAES